MISTPRERRVSMKSDFVKRVFVEVKRAMREKFWRADRMAALMCSPIRPVPPIMRMALFWGGEGGIVIVPVGERDFVRFGVFFSGSFFFLFEGFVVVVVCF